MDARIKYADDEITFWEKIARTKQGSYITEIEKRTILKAHDLVGKPAIAFEIGYEGGRWSRLLADLGWNIICTDINPDVLEICQGRIPTAKCILTSPNESKIPCGAEIIDLLLCIEAFPVIHSEWLIDEAFRVLR